jgi:hypothetical protein
MNKNCVARTLAASFVTASLLVFATPSTAQSAICLAGGNENSLRCDFATLEQCQASASGGLGYCVANPATAKPWPAPVGHRQPRENELPNDAQRSESGFESNWLDKSLDGKLKICRGC